MTRLRRGSEAAESGAIARGLPLGVLRTLARLVTAVFFALDLARIARQHAVFAQHRSRYLGSGQQRARNTMAYGVGLCRAAAAFHRHDRVVLALGRGDLEGLKD